MYQTSGSIQITSVGGSQFLTKYVLHFAYTPDNEDMFFFFTRNSKKTALFLFLTFFHELYLSYDGCKCYVLHTKISFHPNAKQLVLQST